MKNGSLVQYIEQNPQFDRFQPSLELASAVAYLHDVGIVHGDIKSDNVIISDDGHVQLGDFGSASLLEYASVSFTNTGFHGTLRFMAPEILKGEQPTKESDVYALGMVSHPHSFSANHMMNIGVANIDDIYRTIPFKVTAQKVQPERPDFPGLFVDQAAKDELCNWSKGIANGPRAVYDSSPNVHIK
ncbi:kinase domain protein, partial [Rhizoctonia solani AG-3 Rhs1AP]